jgi:integrase/recombinase XerD
MGGELVKASDVNVPAVNAASSLPVLVERAGGAARFAWDEFFFAEHHNPHTQKAYMAAVKRFLAWAEGQGVELPAITPGMVGQYPPIVSMRSVRFQLVLRRDPPGRRRVH